MDVHSMTPITDTTEHTPEPVKKNAKKHRSPYFLIGPIIAMIALAAIFAAQTFAYFTDSAVSENNRIVTGSLDVSLIEVSDDGNYTWSADPIRIMPAGIYTYGGVGAKNSGTIPIYVRIKAEKNILRSEHEISPGWEDLIVCNFKTDAESPWVYHEGYYYYKFALASEEQTRCSSPPKWATNLKTALFNSSLFANRCRRTATPLIPPPLGAGLKTIAHLRKEGI